MKFLKIFLSFTFLASIMMLYLPLKTKADISVSAKTAILMEQKSGRVLYEKNPDEVRRIASITKIMTAILAIESGEMNDTVKVSEAAVRAEGSSIYLKPNEKIKLKDLVYGLMLRSGNDAAVAIAEHVGGSLDGFVFLMNQKAAQIGMKNTHFANPHGLDDHEDHYSTAYDMALLTRYAMNNDTFKKISGTKIHRAPNPNEKWDRVWKNKNRLLTELYKYTTGGKTGFTKRAKRTLVTTASKGDLDLIAVTLNGPDDWNDHINMYENGFDQYDLVKIVKKGTIKEINHPFYKNKVILKDDVLYPITPEERNEIKVSYILKKPNENRISQQKGQVVVGKVAILLNKIPVREVPIYYNETKTEEKKSIFDYFRNVFLIYIGCENK